MLILNQFRWLDSLTFSDKLVSKLLEVLDILPDGLKRTTIALLPEILSEGDPKDVVEKLLDVLDNDVDLAGAVLESLSSLNADTETMDGVVEKVLGQVNSVAIKDLPRMVHFLVLSASAETVDDVVKSLRNKLTAEDSHMEIKAAEKKNHVALTLESLRQAISFQKTVCNALVQTIHDSKDTTVVDIWLLLVVHGLPAYKKMVEKIIRQKTTDGSFTAQLLNSAVEGHSGTISNYFPSLLSLTEQLTRAGGEKQQKVATALYLALFREFKDGPSQHEVIQTLHTHIGSGVNIEAGVALDTLLDLASDPESLQMLSSSQAHLKPLLDYTAGFEDDEIRKVFYLFASLDCVTDLVIIIRKQLSNTELRYKRVGIIGAVALCVFNKGRTTAQATSHTNAERQELLTMAITQCADDVPARMLMYNDICKAIQTGNITEDTLTWFHQQFHEVFEEYLTEYKSDLGVADACASLTQYRGIVDVVRLKPSDHEGLEIVLNVAELLTSKDPRLRDSLLCMCNLFHLVRVLAKKVSGGLDDLDAALECPIYMFEDMSADVESFEKLESSSKDQLCNSLFHAINWCREVLNTWGHQDEFGTGGVYDKVVARLAAAVDLERELITYLQHNETWIPPGTATEEELIRREAILAKEQKMIDDADGPKTRGIKETVGLDSFMKQVKPHLWPLEMSTIHMFIAVNKDHGKSPAQGQVGTSSVNINMRHWLLSDLVLKLKTTLVVEKEIKNMLFARISAKAKSSGIKKMELLTMLTPLTLALKNELSTTISDLDEGTNDHSDVCVRGEILSLTLQCLKYIFQYDSEAETDPDTMQGRLACFVEHTREGLDDTIDETMSQISGIRSHIREVQHACGLVELLEVLTKHHSEHNVKGAMVSETACSFIEEVELSPATNEDKSANASLLKAYITLAPCRLTALEHVVQHHLSTGESLSRLGLLFPTFFRACMEELAVVIQDSAKTLQASVKAGRNCLLDTEIREITTCGKVFGDLMNITKTTVSPDAMDGNKFKVSKETREILSVTLKQGNGIILSLLKVLPLLQKHFRAYKDDILALSKTFGASTRYVHAICAHAKAAQDGSLTKLVPKVPQSILYHCQFLLNLKYVL